MNVLEPIKLNDGEKSQLNFLNTGGEVVIKTRAGSEIKVSFPPNTSFSIFPAGDISSFDVHLSDERTPEPGKLQVVTDNS